MTLLSLIQSHKGLIEEFRRKTVEHKKTVQKLVLNSIPVSGSTSSVQAFESQEDVEKVCIKEV